MLFGWMGVSGFGWLLRLVGSKISYSLCIPFSYSYTLILLLSFTSSILCFFTSTLSTSLLYGHLFALLYHFACNSVVLVLSKFTFAVTAFTYMTSAF